MREHVSTEDQSAARRALAAIRQLREQVSALEDARRVPVAIIGMSCRLPGADSIEALWRMLVEGGEGTGPVPPDRWDAEALYHPDPNRFGRLTSRRGGFLSGLDQFDAAFFGISTREAPHVDPRQRLVMELAWEALEDAGIPPGSLAGSRTSTIMSVLTPDYEVISRDEDRRVEMYTGTGMSNTIVSNRLAYVLDLQGPSLTVDTACSGSLVAMHLAARDLAEGTADLSIVGGVAVNLLYRGEMVFSRAGALAADGRCKTFDASADGIVRSEGAALVVLKRLDKAMADGDRIYAVLRGSAVNQDGRSNGMMAPNGAAQRAVLRAAYQSAGVPPESVQYVEAHGTGTPLGDPIEVLALNDVLGPGRGPGEVCRLGSIKTNVGHTEPTAGVAGVVKAALCLHHRELVPSLHYARPNPKIPFGSIPLEVQTERGPWPRPDAPLRAGVSAFGFGGTNAHVVLEEAPRTQPAPAAELSEGAWGVLPVSARSRGALRALVAAWRERLDADIPSATLAALLRGAATAREVMPERAAFVGRSAAELRAALADWLEAEPSPPPENSGRIVFVFSGQGAFWFGMGSQLYRRSAVFAEAFDAADAAFQALGSAPLRPRIDAISTEPEGETDEVDAALAQQATFATQVALTALWRSWGVAPDAVLGHSLGEVAAAYASGALNLEQAATIVFHRSRRMAEVEGQGATAVVGLPPDQVVLRLSRWGADLAIAGNNSPDTTTLSGTPESIDACLAELVAEGRFAKRVHGVRTAFHGPQMDPVQEALEQDLGGLTPQDTDVEFLSTVEAEAIDGSALHAEYWGRNVREPFRFAEVVDELLSGSPPLFVEIAPHRLLSPAIQKTARGRGVEVGVVCSMARGVDGSRSMAEAVARAFVLGLNPDWERLNPRGPRSLDLPRYPWQRERYWLDQVPAHSPPLVPWLVGASGGASGDAHPLLGDNLSIIGEDRDFWTVELSQDAPSWLGDHRALGRVILPGAAMAEMALAAAAQRGQAATITSLAFVEAMPLQAEPRRVQVQTDGGRAGRQIEVYSQPPGDAGGEPAVWRLHARARLVEPAELSAPQDLAALRARCDRAVSIDEHYQRMRALGLDYGLAFQTVRELWCGSGEVLGRVAVDPLMPIDRYHLHPVLLDGCFQLAVHLGDGVQSRLPEGLERLSHGGRQVSAVWCHLVSRAGEDPSLMQVDLRLLDEHGAVIAEVSGLGLRAIEAARPAQRAPADLTHTLAWLLEALPSAPEVRREGQWLVLGEGALAAQIEAGLREAWSREVLRTSAAVLDAPEALRALLARIGGQALPWEGVVLAAPAAPLDGAPDPLQAAEASTRRLVALLQAIGGMEQAAGAPPRLWVLTRGALDGAALDGAALWGAARVIALEMPALWGGIVDSDADADAGASAALLREISAGVAGSFAIDRAGERLVPRLRQASAAEGPLPLSRASTVLVTGGFTGLGLEMARALVDQGARRLVLVGRTALPPRRMWQDLPADHPAAARVAAVLDLEARGAAVHPLQADVSDRAALGAALEAYDAEGYPPIRGVLHAAGVLRDAMVLRLDGADISAVMGPKLGGALNLSACLAGKDLDFFVLCSSLTAVVGQVGQTSYAAANACLDALAHRLRAQGLRACSINWGPWAEVGMFARLDAGKARSLAAPLSPSLGVASLLHVLRADLVNPVVVDLAQIPDAPLFAELRREGAPTAGVAEEAGGGEPLLELFLLDRPARRAAVTAWMERAVGKVFHAAPGTLSARLPLANLGLDSLMAIEVAEAVRAAYGVKLPIQDVFSLSVRSLVERVLEQVVLDESVLSALLDEVEGAEAVQP